MISSVVCAVCIGVFAGVTVHTHRIAGATGMIWSDGGLVIRLGVDGWDGKEAEVSGELAQVLVQGGITAVASDFPGEDMLREGERESV